MTVAPSNFVNVKPLKGSLGRTLVAQDADRHGLAEWESLPRDEAVNSALGTSYFARGSGRTWNFTIFGRVPLPPSWCQGVYIE